MIFVSSSEGELSSCGVKVVACLITVGKGPVDPLMVLVLTSLSSTAEAVPQAHRLSFSSFSTPVL